MELQTQIRKYRKTLNLSQEELAEKIYVTRQTISNWKMEFPKVKDTTPQTHAYTLLAINKTWR